jgi:hypothetical protein
MLINVPKLALDYGIAAFVKPPMQSIPFRPFLKVHLASLLQIMFFVSLQKLVKNVHIHIRAQNHPPLRSSADLARHASAIRAHPVAIVMLVFATPLFQVLELLVPAALDHLASPVNRPIRRTLFHSPACESSCPTALRERNLAHLKSILFARLSAIQQRSKLLVGENPWAHWQNFAPATPMTFVMESLANCSTIRGAVAAIPKFVIHVVPFRRVASVMSWIAALANPTVAREHAVVLNQLIRAPHKQMQRAVWLRADEAALAMVEQQAQLVGQYSLGLAAMESARHLARYLLNQGEPALTLLPASRRHRALLF